MNLLPCCWGVVESLVRQIHGPCCAAREFPWPICRVEGSWCWRQHTSSQLKTSADGTFYMFIQCAYNTYNYADIITGLLESNTCMTWDLWGVRIWRFWIMMRMERFQDCFGVSNVANFCSTRPHVVQSLFHSEVCSGCSHCAAQRSGVCTWERLLVEQKQTALPAFFFSQGWAWCFGFQFEARWDQIFGSLNGLPGDVLSIEYQPVKLMSTQHRSAVKDVQGGSDTPVVPTRRVIHPFAFD